jgi:hypothetical protein
MLAEEDHSSAPRLALGHAQLVRDDVPLDPALVVANQDHLRSWLRRLRQSLV